METRKLYYEDPFQKGFATTVVSCDAVKGGYAVVLAETAFYPEGGGINSTCVSSSMVSLKW